MAFFYFFRSIDGIIFGYLAPDYILGVFFDLICILEVSLIGWSLISYLRLTVCPNIFVFHCCLMHPSLFFNFLENLGHFVLKALINCLLFVFLLFINFSDNPIQKFHYQRVVISILTIRKDYIAFLQHIVI